MRSRMLLAVPWESHFLGFPLRSLGSVLACHTLQALSPICGTLRMQKGKRKQLSAEDKAAPALPCIAGLLSALPLAFWA